MEQFSVAMMNRSVRNIRTELDFLVDAGHITPAQHDTILSQLPDAPASRTSSVAPIASPQPVAAAATPSLPIRNSTPATTVASPPPPAPATAPIHHHNTNNNNEKVGYYANNPTPPPPAYAAAPPAPAALCTATALYAYQPTDAGDLALQPNDRVQVTEYMNAEWWKGRSERSGQEGIFPRSYVRVEDSKMPPTPAQQSMSYGNMPMAVSQGGGGSSSDPAAQQQQQNGQPGKGQEMGKKFGKKLGNAAIFGAGATIGSNIVNGIL